MAIFLPTNQKRLTNVSIVRLRKGGRRFEVACYPNKVNAWRSQLEDDLDEVLHTQTVFTNVSKGEFAKKGDLEKVFGTANQSDICRQILAKGELQVTEKERHSNLDALFSDTAKIVSQKTVNPVTQRAYSVAIIEKAMRACHLKVLPNRSAKQQASEAIVQLQRSGELALELAMMRVQLQVSGDRVSATVMRRVRAVVRERAVEMITDELQEATSLTMTCLVEPGALNELEELVQNETRGRYELEVSRQAGAVSLGAEAKGEESEEEKEEKDEEEAGRKGKKHRRRKKDKGDAEEEKEEKGGKEKEEEEGEDASEKKPRRRRRRKKEEEEGAAKPSSPMPPKEEEESWEEPGGRRRGRRRRKSRSASESKAP